MEKELFRKYIFWACLVAGVVLLVCFVLLASVPPVSRDALTHHLIIPKLYLSHGGIFEIPYIEFSYYPMNLDMLYMIPLSFGNDIIPKYIHFSFALLTAVLIFSYLKEKTDKNWGKLGAFFFLTIPVIIKLSTTVYVDLGLIFFSTAAILQILKWRNNNFVLKYLIYSAIFCGLALGTKYNGLVTFFILSLFVVFIYSRSKSPNLDNQLNSLKYGSIFIIVSLMIFSPWFIKNMVWTGNPIYPLLNDLLNFKDSSDGVVSVTSASNGWGHFAIRKVIYGEKWWEILLIPIRIFFQGADNNPKYFDGILNPFLFILPFFAFDRKKETLKNGISDKKILLFFSALFIIIVFLRQDMRIRWIGPAIPPLILLSVFGLKNISDFFSSKKKWREIVTGLIILGVTIINIHYLFGQFNQVKPFEFISGKISRTEYIKGFWPEISTIAYANKNLGPNCEILALFLGNRRYYSDHKMIFDHDMFKTIIIKSNKIEDIVNDLNKNGFTNIIINYGLFSQWAEKQFTNNEKILIKKLFGKMELLYTQDGFGLYTLKPFNQ